jgi:NADH-quinone oxidoreductase subunit I
MSIFEEYMEAAKAILAGLSITGRHVFEKPVTFEYPEHPKPLAPRFKGRHILQRYENGLERCIGCALCASACPSDAIYVVPGENDPGNPTSPGERCAVIYEINLLRCIFCGFCEDACPVEAVVLKHNYELSEYTREIEIIDKSVLLVPREQGFGTNPYVGAMGEGGRQSVIESIRNQQ